MNIQVSHSLVEIFENNELFAKPTALSSAEEEEEEESVSAVWTAAAAAAAAGLDETSMLCSLVESCEKS